MDLEPFLQLFFYAGDDSIFPHDSKDFQWIPGLGGADEIFHRERIFDL
jgi:hypothetical protein